MPRVNISCVSYLNSAPFIYGLQNHKISDEIILSLDTPASCALKLQTGQVDIGLIPVAAISTVENAHQITNWCIGANGPVKSVTLLSHVPLNEIKSIFLDFQSLTSNRLTQILAYYYWKINPVFLSGQHGFENLIAGDTAGVVIGDRSLQLQHKFKFVYDLSGEWNNFTNLPFVFARWVSNKKIDNQFLENFNEALSFGILQIDKVIAQLKTSPGFIQDIDQYLSKSLSYTFDEEKKKGMDLFLKYSKNISVSEVRASL